MTLSEEDRRLVGLWAAECAERVLPLFEVTALPDTRPREVDDPAATAAARAAGYAAASAYMHALATLDQAKHALAPATYAARARELAAVEDPTAGDEEIRWAIAHAPPAVREVMRRMPARGPGRGRLDALYYQLDAGLRR